MSIFFLAVVSTSNPKWVCVGDYGICGVCSVDGGLGFFVVVIFVLQDKTIDDDDDDVRKIIEIFNRKLNL